MTDLTDSLPEPSAEEKAELRQHQAQYMRMQCLDNAVKLHNGSYDGSVVIKTARAFYDFVTGADHA